MSKGIKRGILTAIIAIAAILAFACVVCAEVGAIWGTYHNDSLRRGLNDQSRDISNPASLNLIWAFPRGVGGEVDEAKTIVDDLDPLYFTPDRTWFTSASSGPAAEDAWETHFLWTHASSSYDVNDEGVPNYAVRPVRWDLPSELGTGRFLIMVWVPSAYNSGVDDNGNPKHHNTTVAEYTVYDATGATTIKFDQTIGGEWRLLTNRQFDFAAGGYVTLSNVTSDTPDYIAVDNTIVVADAIKFVPATGAEIYASVASAEINWSGSWDAFDEDINNDGEIGDDEHFSAGSYSGPAAVVYAATVESPLANSQTAPDSGAVYCINSITPTVQAVNDITDSKDQLIGLAHQLGTSIWRYPRAAQQRYDGTTVSGTAVAPNVLEGPIEGGFYASPTLASVGGKLICYVAGMDRQVYALDATTGALLWKGPGVTISETSDLNNDGGSLHSDAVPVAPAEAFGGAYHYVKCSDEADQMAAMWTFTEEKRQRAGEPSGGDGLAYSVYAYIPAKSSMEPMQRAVDATYIITYAGSSGDVTSTVKIDQSDLSNQGKWVTIGSSYFNVKSVKLITHATPVGEASVTSYVVVADAMQIIPDTIDAFGYCTPVVDIDPNETGVTQATTVYAISTSGRVIAFDAQNSDTTRRIGATQWIFPKVRTKLVVSGEADMDLPGLGQMAGSPAYYVFSGKGLIFAGFDGRVYNLTNPQDGSMSGPPSNAWADNDIVDANGFTSSPAIGSSSGGTRLVFIGATSGVFYALGLGSGEAVWAYPKLDADGNVTTALPLGSFRYSTPAVATVAGLSRVWVGSSDSKIYSFLTAEGTRIQPEYDSDGDIVLTDPLYIEPSASSPLQASIAITGTDRNTTGTTGKVIMLVGDMGERGILHWYNAKTGESDWKYDYDDDDDTAAQAYQGWTCEGPLFSSPNITNLEITASAKNFSYVYNGCGDGRVYAWSHEGGAWGGKWAGGRWPFSGQPDHGDQGVISLAPNTDVQFDLFNELFYNNCQSLADTNVQTEVDAWPADPAYIVSKEMKKPTGTLSTDDDIDTALRNAAYQRRTSTDAIFPRLADRQTTSDQVLYLEWGEKVNMILWNLPGLEYLYGTGESQKRTNIRFNMVNTSAGASAGSQVNLRGTVKLLKEYAVVSDDTETTGEEGAPTTYKPLLYEDATEVKRCYAIAQIDIKGTGSNPPSPGPGWVISAEIRRKTTNAKDAPVVQETIPIARLTTTSPPKPATTQGSTTDSTIRNYIQQLIGINNPLAIKTSDSITITGGGWPIATNLTTNRNQNDAHYNGNGVYTAATEGAEATYEVKTPLTLSLGVVAHGTSSKVVPFGVMDRSATGLNLTSGKQQTLDRFRVNAGDLRWPSSGVAALTASGGTVFDWELGLYSADYPPIYKRFESYRKNYDDLDPSLVASKLPPLYVPTSGLYNDATLRPDVCNVSVAVPRFQPANWSGSWTGSISGNNGYLRTMQAYLDSNGNGLYDSGNTVVGRPTTYQEVYRTFQAGVEVPPDPRIEIDEQLIDIGQAPHGMGEDLWSVDYLDFMPANPNPEVRQWFKRITVKNAGNVNLYNLAVGRDYPLFMIRDPRSLSREALAATPILSGTEIRSSLDAYTPGTQKLKGMKLPPLFTDSLGYTLTKPRVGDPDPTILSIPDKRKWDADYQGTQAGVKNAYATALAGLGLPPAVDTLQPFSVEVSVSVPIGQPIGTYEAPYVPVYATFGTGGVARSDPSFGLKVTVRENQLTGDRSPASLAQIDAGTLPKFGDATPAAYRDRASGKVQLFWSSNRMYDSSLFPPAGTAGDDPAWAQFASAPWFIDQATLGWDDTGNIWAPTSDAPPRWWQIPPAGAGGRPPIFSSVQWPTPLLGSNMEGASVMQWKFGSTPTTLLSVKHHSPTIVQNLDVGSTAIIPTWLAWAGTADVEMPDGKLAQESRIFYTSATGGTVMGSGGTLDFIPHDPTMEKRYPSFSVFNSGDSVPMWAFWQGGDAGKWSIYYSVNPTSPYPIPGWSDDFRLRTPDCLASVSSPNAIHRTFWANLKGSEPDASNAKHMFDMVYAGSNRVSQASDIILSRYAAVPPADTANSAAAPSSIAQPMPRVFGETLQRDPKFGFYTGEHLAWVRLNPSEVAAGTVQLTRDNWGNYDMTNPNVNPDLPYVHVYFPENYIIDLVTNAAIVAKDCTVSGSDGCVRDPSGAVTYDPGILTLDPTAGEDKFRLQIDQATGIYTYKYPAGSVTKRVLGDMLVDFSAGVVRFTEPLREVRITNDDGTVSVNAPQVRADYTPLSWRLTTDPAVDNSARAFIERTPMSLASNPGITPTGLVDMSVDRLWAFWRRAGTAVKSSTIFWKTYRVGVDLARLGYPPIQMKPDGGFAAGAPTITGNLGPWEVDRTGTKVYFSQVDERYRSLFRNGSTEFLTTNPTPPAQVWNGAPVPIRISYKPAGASQDTTATAYDVFWLNELPEQSLFGYVGNASVNEGSVYAFADTYPEPVWRADGKMGLREYPKIWVFWTTTRGGTSDLCSASLSPNFSAR